MNTAQRLTVVHEYFRVHNVARVPPLFGKNMELQFVMYVFARNLDWTKNANLNHNKTMAKPVAKGHCLDLDESRLQLR